MPFKQVLSMPGRKALFGAASLLYGLQIAAAPVHVKPDWPNGRPPASQALIHIQAVRIVGSAENTAPVEVESTPDGTVLDLGDAVWQFHASADGYWSQETEVAVTGQTPVSVRLILWPSASLQGDIRMLEGELPSSSIKVQLNAAPGMDGANGNSQQAEQGPAHAELNCRISAGSWNCPAPVGLYDIRLEAAGFAPRYLWGVRLEKGKSSGTGSTVLRRTASVLGEPFAQTVRILLGHAVQRCKRT